MAILRRNVYVRGAVEQGFVGYSDAAFVWSDEAGDAIEESGFARARRAEKNGDTGRNGKIDVELKCAAGRACANAKLG